MAGREQTYHLVLEAGTQPLHCVVGAREVDGGHPGGQELASG